MIVLAGDVGGTQTRMALFEVDGTRLTPLIEKNYSSNAFPNFDLIIEDFFAIEKFKAEAICIGIAGPVQNGVCETTNLPWNIDIQRIARTSRIDCAVLINDLVANAWGIQALSADDFQVINPGLSSPSGNACIISAGTGLGQAGMFWDGIQYRPYASEGGHCGFSATTEQDFRLLKFLQQRYNHVSWERIVSGMGIANIFEFLVDDYAITPPDWFIENNQQGDPAAAIAQRINDCKVCAETIKLFTHFYAVETANLALKTMATGGIYIGGGIAPKLLEHLQDPSFYESFIAKGRMSRLLTQMPLKVILNDQTALYGSALCGANPISNPTT